MDACCLAAAAAAQAELEARITELVCEATGFPEEQVQPNMRLLEDLNLDSIKVGELIARLGQESGLPEDGLDPMELGNASVQELAAAVAAALPQAASSGKAAAAPPQAAAAAAAPAPKVALARLPDAYAQETWVRDFTMKLYEVPLPHQALSPMELMPLAIVFGPEQGYVAKTLAVRVHASISFRVCLGVCLGNTGATSCHTPTAPHGPCSAPSEQCAAPLAWALPACSGCFALMSVSPGQFEVAPCYLAHCRIATLCRMPFLRWLAPSLAVSAWYPSRRQAPTTGRPTRWQAATPRWS
jgi:acyl carrier protein